MSEGDSWEVWWPEFDIWDWEERTNACKVSSDGCVHRQTNALNINKIYFFFNITVYCFIRTEQYINKLVRYHKDYWPCGFPGLALIEPSTQAWSKMPLEFGSGLSLAQSHFGSFNEDSDSWVTGSFSHAHGQTPDKASWGREVLFRSLFEGTVRHERGGMGGEIGSNFGDRSMRGLASLLPYSGIRKRWMLVHGWLFPTPLLIQSGTPANRMMPPTFKAGLLSPIRAPWKHPFRHSQKWNS